MDVAKLNGAEAPQPHKTRTKRELAIEIASTTLGLGKQLQLAQAGVPTLLGAADFAD